jgi:HPr kinase/phosphorylase
MHATAIALDGKGALIRGPSGSGKSDLALRCLGMAASPLIPWPCSLVSDDYVLIELGPGGLMLSAPAALSGLLEVRGTGIVGIAPGAPARLALVVDLVLAHDAIARMPEPETVDILGIAVPRLLLHSFEASAPLKMLLVMARS